MRALLKAGRVRMEDRKKKIKLVNMIFYIKYQNHNEYYRVKFKSLCDINFRWGSSPKTLSSLSDIITPPEVFGLSTSGPHAPYGNMIKDTKSISLAGVYLSPCKRYRLPRVGEAGFLPISIGEASGYNNNNLVWWQCVTFYIM